MPGFDVCPWWMGYIIDNPLRTWWQNPEKLLRRYIKPGYVCLDIGCGMGFFSRPMARCTGHGGVVHSVDLQGKMLAGLARRATKHGLDSIIRLHKCQNESLRLGELTGLVDFALAGYMIHETPDQFKVFSQVARCLRPAGSFLVLEPSGHISKEAFVKTLAHARQAGFAMEEQPKFRGSRTALLRKMSA